MPNHFKQINESFDRKYKEILKESASDSVVAYIDCSGSIREEQLQKAVKHAKKNFGATDIFYFAEDVGEDPKSVGFGTNISPVLKHIKRSGVPLENVVIYTDDDVNPRWTSTQIPDEITLIDVRSLKPLIFEPDGVQMEMDFNESLARSIKSVLRRINEAPMSDEDRADTQALRKLYYKLRNTTSANPRLTKQEKELLKKYNIYYNGSRDSFLNYDTQQSGAHIGAGAIYNVEKNPNYNLANHARTLADKNRTGWTGGTRSREHRKGSGPNYNFTDRDRRKQAYDMGKDYREMKYWKQQDGPLSSIIPQSILDSHRESRENHRRNK